MAEHLRVSRVRTAREMTGALSRLTLLRYKGFTVLRFALLGLCSFCGLVSLVEACFGFVDSGRLTWNVWLSMFFLFGAFGGTLTLLEQREQRHMHELTLLIEEMPDSQEKRLAIIHYYWSRNYR
jgi:hypothetical protein